MFIGHFAVGFAAKRVVPRVSLAMLLFAALFADVLWPVLVLLGFEQVRIDPGNTAYTPLQFVSYPWSHSLLMLAIWGACIGGAYRGIAGGRRTFVVLAALVVSHWVLDWITHAPDMPIYPHGPTYGLTLWSSIAGTMLVEGAMFAAGLYVYMRSTHATDRIGRWAFVSLAWTLGVLYIINSASVSTPPPSVTAICVIAIAASVLFPAWAWLADRHRRSDN